MPLLFTWPLDGGWKQRDHAPVDVVNNGDLYRSNWWLAYYLLQNKYPSIHTGDDIIRIKAVIYGMIVRACTDGEVTYSQDVVNETWRQTIVIRHQRDDGRFIYSRYAHLKDRLVKVGDKVLAGQVIAHVGDAQGELPPHLHFDICITNLLFTDPKNWPSTGRTAAQATAFIRANYVDPKLYIAAEIAANGEAVAPVITPDPINPPELAEYKTLVNLYIRTGPAQSYPLVTGAPNYYKTGTIVTVDIANVKLDEVSGYHYAPTPDDMWIAFEPQFVVPVVVAPPPPPPPETVYTLMRVIASRGLVARTQPLKSSPKQGQGYAFGGLVHLALGNIQNDPVSGYSYAETDVHTWVAVSDPFHFAYVADPSDSLPPTTTPPAATAPRRVYPTTSIVGVHHYSGGELVQTLDMLHAAGHDLDFVLAYNWSGNQFMPSQIKARSPKTKVMQRVYWKPQPDYRTPASGTASATQMMTAYFTNPMVDRAADWHQIDNEPTPDYGTPAFWIRAMDLAEQVYGVKLAVGCWPYFWPAFPGEMDKGVLRYADTFLQWDSTHEMIRRIIAGGHVWMEHRYVYPDPFGPVDAGPMARADTMLTYLPASLQSVPIVVAEWLTGKANLYSGTQLVAAFEGGERYVRRAKANTWHLAAWTAGDWYDGPNNTGNNSNIYQRAAEVNDYWRNKRF